MTPKEVLDSFSETLMRDDRILSAQERALVRTVLQHADAATVENPATREAVRAVIASAVGETVAQRAFAVLGGSIVERILGGSGSGSKVKGTETYTLASPPGTPHPPGMPREPDGPGQPLIEPDGPGITPAPPPHEPLIEPDGPGIVPHGQTSAMPRASVAVVERPALLPARFLALDEFLAPQELEELTRFALEHEAEFSASQVVSATSERGIINDQHRRSRVLMNLRQHEPIMLERIRTVLPDVLRQLEMEPFTIASVEAQITASNDGDFFRFHSDNGSQKVASRYLTFVYFFHREPKQFEDGDLHLHDSRLENGVYVSTGRYQSLAPRQNQIVFFPCQMMHEITPVRCASRNFADSRFTLNGWLRR